ncbi:sigma-70 family RNA polymerase sigma factor [Paludisphaera sp.]|uniref:sigma-70 family RNA polymerase sigma factor n=1 Tax=Paludisphaera sp. TaxID=2017432 RepID=UPI00301CB933
MNTAERTIDRRDELSNRVLLGRSDVELLTPEEERRLLVELDGHRRLLAAASAEMGGEAGEEFDMRDFVRAALGSGPPASDEEAVLRAVAAAYNATRGRLAMANLRLVAHVARRFNDRGLSDSDLLQEGFCGLLTAIDRYDVSNTTRLASYAVWWIRQALQRAVAAGAYPVRLNPRHLQKLAEVSHEAEALAPSRRARSASAEATLKQIHAATRPALSLDAPLGDEGGRLMDVLCSPADEEVDEFDREERLAALLERLKPREQTVLRLRFGLDGGESHSLSEVSQVLSVSKERIRQIQDAALAKLRVLADAPALSEVG